MRNARLCKEEQLLDEIEQLRARLEEAEQTLQAIRSGEVDALVVETPQGDRVFTLTGAEHVYRIITETMHEAALTVSLDGTILFCNRRFCDLMNIPMNEAVGQKVTGFVSRPQEQPLIRFLSDVQSRPAQRRLTLRASDGAAVPVQLSGSLIVEDSSSLICLIAADLTEIEASAKSIRVLRESQQALEESEERYRTLFETMTEGFAQIVTGREGRPSGYRFLDVNPAFERVTGLKREEVVGKRVLELLPGIGRRLVENHGQVLLLGEPLRMEEYSAALDRWYEIFAYRSAPDRLAVVFTDITKRKRAEEALRRSEEKFRFVATSIPDTLFFQDKELRYIWIFNPAGPLREDQVVGKTDADLLPPEEAGRLTEIKRKVLETGAGTRTELQLSPGGITRWYEAVYEPSRDSGGRIAGLVSYTRDITERKEAEGALRQASERYEQQVRLFEGVASTTPDFVYLFDLQGRFLYANRRLLEVWGMGLQEVIGKTPRELGYEQWHHDMHMREIAQVIETKRPIKGEVPFKAPLTGIFGVYEYIFTPVIGPDSEVELIAGTTRDVTERKQMEEEIRKSRDDLDLRVRERTTELVRKNQELQEFAFVASHDLNEPLRKIQTFGSLLEAKSAGCLVEEQRDYISRMIGAANRMQDLLAALLNYSRIETKGEPFRPTPLDRVVQDALSDMEVGIRDAGARVRVGPLSSVRGDPNQLRQLFQNLIANSLKYHRPGVRPFLRIHEETVNGRCRIHVVDNGIGFDEKYLDKVFQPFQRLHGKTEYSGLGIGLAICKKIVERHGGTITAKSSPGKGSTFIVTLPMDPGGR